MTCEALWSVEFKANNQDFGAGILVLETNRCLGGDTSYTYIGDFQLDNHIFKARLRIKKFNDLIPPLFKEDYMLSLEGEYKDDVFEISGSPDGSPEFVITVVCTRRAELP